MIIKKIIIIIIIIIIQMTFKPLTTPSLKLTFTKDEITTVTGATILHDNNNNNLTTTIS